LSLTFAQIYAGLHFADHSRWPGGTLTFSIPGFGSTWSPSSYPPGDEPSNAAYGVLNSDQRAAFVDAVGAWGQLINLELLEVPDNGFSQGAIRVAFTHALDYTQDETAAYAYGPPLPGSSAFAFEGDIWFDDFFKTEDPYVGGFFYETMLH
jgi:hypothetical protein